MKSNCIHVCFVIDKSSSMSCSTKDVVDGFKKVVEEQKAIKEGTCLISLYTFADNVRRAYLGVDANEISGDLVYYPDGMTAMCDGIGQAIDEVGEWLAGMPEEERPEKNLFVIMTDGYENFSTRYTLKDVHDRIEHQTNKYSWTFMYLGTNVMNLKDAERLGIKYSSANTRDNLGNSIDSVCYFNTVYRTTQGDAGVKACALETAVNSYVASANAQYLEDTNIDVTTSNDNSVSSIDNSSVKASVLDTVVNSYTTAFSACSLADTDIDVIISSSNDNSGSSVNNSL